MLLTSRIITVVLFVICICSGAAFANERQKLTERLVASWDLGAIVDAVQTQCSDPKSSGFDPGGMFLKDPAAFGGVSPQSKYWPEVEAAYARYQRRLCGSVNAKELAKMYGEVLARELSTDELRKSVEYYESAAGRKLMRSSVRANEEFMRSTADKYKALSTDAFAETQTELRAIAEKYRRKPE
jgi:hypothetical protein